MTIHGVDARVLCGQDVRRSGLWPSDRSRIDTFALEYGGSLEAFPVGDVAIAIRWHGPNNQVVTETAQTAAEALRRLRSTLRAVQ